MKMKSEGSGMRVLCWNNRTNLLLIPSLLIFTFCHPTTSKEPVITDKKTTEPIVDSSLADAFQNVLPSPFEMAQLLSQSQASSNLHLYSRPSKFPPKQSDSLKALHLGASAVYFGLINLKGQSPFLQNSIQQFQKISTDLQVGQFVDYAAMCRSANKRSAADSLLAIGVRNISTMNKYFKQNNRADLCILIQIGAWIEGLQIYRQLAQESPCEDLYTCIAEQKETLSQLESFLSKVDYIPFYAQLHKRLIPLSIAYKEVSVENHAFTIIHPDHEHSYVTDLYETRVKITEKDKTRITGAIEKLYDEIFM